MTLNDMGGYPAMTMPVQPIYGGGMPAYGGGLGFGGDGWWIILLLLLGGGMWGGIGMGGWGGMMGAGMMGMDWLYPWLSNSRQIGDGFQNQQTVNQISDARSDINRGFSDVQLGIAGLGRQICETGNGISGAVRDGFFAAETSANNRHMNTVQRLFDIQTTQLQGSNAVQGAITQNGYENRLATCQTQSIIQAEAAANRAAGNSDTQRILDKLCQIEQDTLKARLDAKDDTIAQLRSEVLYARGQASQVAQTAQITDAVYQRLATCPVGTTPVFGNQPIFNCQRAGCPGGVQLAS